MPSKDNRFKERNDASEEVGGATAVPRTASNTSTSRHKSCFVVMPIGATGTPEHKQFKSILDVIIRPAAESCGYEVTRADESTFTGNITTEIVKNLADADLVIADLTTRNPNVYLELGIRHCLRKSGTIHIIRSDEAIPFDIQAYRAIKYSLEFDQIDATRQAIIDAVLHKERNPGTSDNPVHDALQLPASYRDISAGEKDRKIVELETKLDEKSRELDSAQTQLRSYAGSGVDAPVMPQRRSPRDLAAEVSRILANVRENALPSQLIARAHQAANSGDHEEFIAIAEKLAVSPVAKGPEFTFVARLAGELGLEQVQMLLLEQAAAVFPHDSQLRNRYAERCIHSSSPELQDRGRRLLEQSLGIEWHQGKAVFGRGPVADGDHSVGVLLDFFYVTDRSVEGLTLANAAREAYGDTKVILRNIARAYEAKLEYEEAEAWYKRAFDADPNDDTLLGWFGNFYTRRGNFEAARRLHVSACMADPKDPRLVIALIGSILSEVESRGRNAVGHVADEAVMSGLGALAISLAPGNIEVRTTVSRYLALGGYGPTAKKCLEPQWPGPGVAPDSVLGITDSSGAVVFRDGS